MALKLLWKYSIWSAILLYWRNSDGVSLGSGFSSGDAGLETASAIGGHEGIDSVDAIAAEIRDDCLLDAGRVWNGGNVRERDQARVAVLNTRQLDMRWTTLVQQRVDLPKSDIYIVGCQG